MKNILITGGGGFLGKKLILHFCKLNYNVICTCRSNYKIKTLDFMKKKYQINFEILKTDITSDLDILLLKEKIISHKIQYIIHCASMKYIEISEKEPSQTIKTNIIGTMNIIKIALETNIKNLIGLSTDKAIDPTTTYGMTKNLMEKVIIEAGFTVYRGVNFLWSDGSVLEIWRSQMISKLKLSVTNFDQVRYYEPTDAFLKNLTNNLDVKKQIISPKKILKISLLELFEIFKHLYQYNNYEIVGNRDKEKMIEQIDQISDVKNENRLNLIEFFKKEKENNFNVSGDLE